MKKNYLYLLSVILFAGTCFAQWVQVSTVPTSQLNAVKFFDAYTGVTCGVGGIWRSTNSGVNWSQVLTTSVSMNSISFPNNNIGFCVGDSGKMFKTVDGGVNWNLIGAGVTTKNLNGVSFVSASDGWIVGQSCKILHTPTGGGTFFNQSIIGNDTTRDINYIQMINSSTGYLCGSSNTNEETFLLSGNGGFSWVYGAGSTGNMLRALSYIPVSSGNLLAVGTNGRIKRTTTNGTTWTTITSPTNVHLNHIIFLDANTGYIAGNSGNILKTTNSGSNWFVDAVVTLNNLRCLSFSNSTTAWCVGSNGVVIRQGIPVGVKQIVNNVLNGFSLNQNFPNPFNPSTVIKFNVPNASEVKLIVYDALGREVAELINGFLKPGGYEAEWDAGEFASGVYYYSLSATTAENTTYMETKKMVLIK